jgi:hypothetical protein
MLTQTVQLAIMPACLLEEMEASRQLPPNTFRVRMSKSLTHSVRYGTAAGVGDCTFKRT